jgi:amino acid permease
MVALLQFAGLIIMGLFLLAGGNLSSHGGVYEFIGYLSIGFGVFGSSLLFYLAHGIMVKEGNERNQESILYKNINKNVDKGIEGIKRLRVN